MNKEYEGFSKQDLIDRRGALVIEWQDLQERKYRIDIEIKDIDKLLEKK